MKNGCKTRRLSHYVICEDKSDQIYPIKATLKSFIQQGTHFLFLSSHKCLMVKWHLIEADKQPFKRKYEAFTHLTCVWTLTAFWTLKRKFTNCYWLNNLINISFKATSSEKKGKERKRGQWCKARGDLEESLPRTYIHTAQYVCCKLQVMVLSIVVFIYVHISNKSFSL